MLLCMSLETMTTHEQLLGFDPLEVEDHLLAQSFEKFVVEFELHQ